MLQFQVIDDFKNPNLPISNTGSALNMASALRIYEMKSAVDKSKFGIPLSISGLTFDDEGLVLDGVAGHQANTSLIEPEEFTIITAFKAAIPAVTAQVHSSLAEAASPFTGSRMAVTTTGAVAVNVGANPTAGVTTSVIMPAWEMFAETVSATKVTITRGSNMGKLTGDITGRRPALNSIIIGGGYQSPHNVGFKGSIGVWAAYAGVLSDATIADLFAKVRSIMAQRGIYLP